MLLNAIISYFCLLFLLAISFLICMPSSLISYVRQCNDVMCLPSEEVVTTFWCSVIDREAISFLMVARVQAKLMKQRTTFFQREPLTQHQARTLTLWLDYDFRNHPLSFNHTENGSHIIYKISVQCICGLNSFGRFLSST